jgi:hypothetical protein
MLDLLQQNHLYLTDFTSTEVSLNNNALIEKVAAATSLDARMTAVDAMHDAVNVSNDVKLMYVAKSARSTTQR